MRSPTIAEADYQRALAAYRALNDSTMQRRLRADREWFLAAVYWQPGDYDVKHLQREFARIRELGFTAVRFHSHQSTETAPGVYDFTRTDDWMNAAAAAGIQVIFHKEHAHPSPGLLAKLGVPAEEYEASFLDDPRHLAALEATVRPAVERYRKHPAMYMWAAYGEPGFAGGPLNDHEKAAFARWLRERYPTVADLDRAWNIYPEKARPIVRSFEQAWEEVGDFGQAVEIIAGAPSRRTYGACRDLMRFQTDRAIARARATIALFRKYDPDHPVAVGSHQLMLNQPMLRWDTGQWARMGDLHFSSIHLSWHFEQVEGEVDRPVYMQARMTRDYFKHGWTSAYETTGGAVQYSGGYGNAMTPGLMRRLMLSYLAAGNVNIAFWTWNHRPGGWEGGEYGLTTLSGEVSAWAKEAAKVGAGMRRHRAELWEADAETRIGLLQSWDTEAVLMLEPERFDLQAAPSKFVRGTKAQASRSYIGAARAFINHRAPFEYVTAQEIAEGIALCYPCIYAPHLRAASDELLEQLLAYVQGGGRLVADVQYGFEDPWGKIRRPGRGSVQERTFGAYVDTIHDARTARRSIGPVGVDGFYGDLAVTTARVLARFDTGAPAITEARIGRGAAVLIGFDAARACLAGNPAVEALIHSLAMGNARTDWECDAPLAFRLAHPAADHYFLVNDGPARPATIKAFDRTYRSGEEVVDARPVEVRGTIAVELPAESAVWLRLER